MKSFKIYKTDSRPMTAKRFWSAIGLMWIISLFSLIIPVVGQIFIFFTSIITIAGIIIILWRVMRGHPAFPNQDSQSKSSNNS